MGSYLGLCGPEAAALEECQVRLRTEREGRAQDRVDAPRGCERRCRAAAAHAAGLARFGFVATVFQRQGLPQRLLGHLVHPEDARSGRYDCVRGAQACLRARAIGTDCRLGATPIDLGNLQLHIGDPVAVLTVDLSPTPSRVSIGVWSLAEAKAQTPPTRFLAPAPDGTLTTTATRYDWWLGQDAALFDLRSKGPMEWFQLFTDSDPTKASMLTLDPDSAGLRVVPLAEPIPSLPFLIQGMVPQTP